MYIDFLKICKTLVKSILFSICFEQEVLETNYTFTLDDGYINSVNKSTFKATVGLKTQLTEPKTVTITLEDSAGNKVTKDVTLPDGASVCHVDFSSVTSGTQSNLVDGPVTVTIAEKNSPKVILGTYTVEKHTAEIATDGIAEVTATRKNSVEASLSFKGYGDSKIVKMYYEYVSYGTSTHTKVDDIDNKEPAAIDIIDNKFNDTIAEDLSPETAYDVYYVLEDEFGSRTNVLGPITITKNSEGVTPFTKLKSVTFPDLSTNALASLNASWDFATDGSPVKPTANYEVFTVTLYRGETPVATEVIKSSQPGTAATATTLTLNKFAKELGKPGVYKLGVVVEGSDEHTSSEPAYSETREVTQLEAVTNFTFDIDPTDSSVILKWDTDYELTTDMLGYDLSIVSIDEEGKETDVVGYTAAVPKSLTQSGHSELEASYDNKAHKFGSAQPGVIYKATITVKAKTAQSAVVNSEESVTKEFFYINVSGINVSATKPSTATLEFTNGPIVVAGQEATYRVEIYEVDDLGGHKNYNKVDTKSVTLTKNEDNKYLVDINGLDSANKYVFRVIANVGDIEGISGFTAELGILKGMPELSNLTVAKEAGEGKIFKKSAAVLSINGEDYTIAQYPGTLGKMAALIDDSQGLKENDKIVSFDGTTLRVDFADSEDVRDLTGKLDGLTLEVVADKHKLTLTTTDAEKVVIEARENPGLVDIDAVKAKEIVLKDGANVTTTKNSGSQPVVIAAGATATIKDIKVTSSSEDTTIALNANYTIDVTPNAASNNLTFEAKGVTGPDNTTDKLVINFKRAAGASESKQQGTITIIPTKLNVTVQSNVLVESNIIANLTDSYLDVTNVELTKAKTVSVTTSKDSGKAKVTGRFAGTLPQTDPGKLNPTFTALPLKEYKKLADLTTLSKSTNVDESNFEAVKEFLAGFGLNDLETATITINDTTNVTLEFVADTPSTQVKGLK